MLFPLFLPFFYLVDKLGFMGEFILCSFLARVGKKRTKETPFKGKRGLVPKNAGNRIFQPCDILSPLKIPLTCRRSRRCRNVCLF